MIGQSLVNDTLELIGIGDDNIEDEQPKANREGHRIVGAMIALGLTVVYMLTRRPRIPLR